MLEERRTQARPIDNRIFTFSSLTRLIAVILVPMSVRGPHVYSGGAPRPYLAANNRLATAASKRSCLWVDVLLMLLRAIRKARPPFDQAGAHATSRAPCGTSGQGAPEGSLATYDKTRAANCLKENSRCSEELRPTTADRCYLTLNEIIRSALAFSVRCGDVRGANHCGAALRAAGDITINHYSLLHIPVTKFQLAPA